MIVDHVWCRIEPVLDDGYVGKGEYKAVPGYNKAYVVGDKSGGKVIAVPQY